MLTILELNDINQLSPFKADWAALFDETVGGTFFQSYEWFETYWRHFGNDKRLRIIMILEGDRTVGIVPLIVRFEETRVGRLRVLTYPLDNWGSYYGPIGPDPAKTLHAAMDHIHNTPRDWDMIELRWIGAPGTDPQHTCDAMQSVGYRTYPTLWNETATVDFSKGWDDYLAERKGVWLRRMRQTEEKLARQARVSFLRCRPASKHQSDGDPHWDLYDSCETIARCSWQASATDGTTLSHDSIRAFLRVLHEKAATAGMVDMSLLMLDDRPAAFIYGYHCKGSVYGLRRGYNPELSRSGLGSVLLWKTLKDSAQRGDRIYDMGIGSIESKRHFQNRMLPIYRTSHFPTAVLRTQILRFGRWLESCRMFGVS